MMTFPHLNLKISFIRRNEGNVEDDYDDDEDDFVDDKGEMMTITKMIVLNDDFTTNAMTQLIKY